MHTNMVGEQYPVMTSFGETIVFLHDCSIFEMVKSSETQIKTKWFVSYSISSDYMFCYVLEEYVLTSASHS